MPPEEHLLGESYFYDASRGVRITNQMVIEIDLDTARWRIKGRRGGKGTTLRIDNPIFVRMMRLVINAMRRESRWHEPVEMLHKPAPEPVQPCPECGGRRFREDAVTGEVWSCPACNPG